MLVDEIFYGLQGEGARMGIPTVFVRTGGCNLRCEGFGCEMRSPLTNEILIGCDTIHAVQKEHFKHLWKDYQSSESLINDIKDAVGIEKYDIVFTGGEPTLHHKTECMKETVRYFLDLGHRVWFETNGTINIDFLTYPVYNDVELSISVKMACSGESKDDRWKPEVIRNLVEHSYNAYLKFVLDGNDQESQNEVFEFLNLFDEFIPVYCMPMGETQTQIQNNAKPVYEFASKYGFCYSDRLHIRIYDDLRGV